jgi:TPR repeat protein
MSVSWNQGIAVRSLAAASRWRNPAEHDLLVAECLASAADGDVAAYFDLGVVYSTGGQGVACDLIEAHKWFNLGAASRPREAASAAPTFPKR